MALRKNFLKIHSVSTKQTPGQRLQDLRVHRQLSTRDVGALAGVSHTQISIFENKEDGLNFRNAKHRDAIRKIAPHLGVQPEYIWSGIAPQGVFVREDGPEYTYESKRQPLGQSASVLLLLLEIATDPEVPDGRREEAKASLKAALESLQGSA